MNRMYWKWSEYYTCKECEDEVNRKGHLTKPRETEFFLLNIMFHNMQRMQDTFLEKKQKKHLVLNMWRMPKISCAVTCKEWGKQFLASRKVMHRKLQWMRKYFFLKKKFIKHQVKYHVLNMKNKTKHEQNLLNSGLNIKPARNVKMRWIVKVILRNLERQKSFYKTSCTIKCQEYKKRLFSGKTRNILCLTFIECGKQFLTLRKVMNRKLHWMR